MAVDVDRVISSLTLAGSALSCLATTFVLISFIIYRRHLRSFRHVLVLNLVVAGTLSTLTAIRVALGDRSLILQLRVHQHLEQFRVGHHLSQDW